MAASAPNRRWLWAAVSLTALKLWFTSGQTIYAIGPAFHDDKLFVSLAAHILDGQWLGPYDQFTLAKGPLFPLFLAGVFWVGLPLMLVQQVLYAGASAAVTRALAPWVRAPRAQFALYALLLLNPMSYDAGNLSRLMRQNIYTPLALLVVAGLAQLFARRREGWRRQAGPAALAGSALGCFWLTREESIWLLPATVLLLLAPLASLGREIRSRARPLLASFCIFLATALLPILAISALNLRYYHWFGTVEFRAGEFKAAYGALTRIQVGPELNQVPVTRQMREQAYAVSPAFARLQPYLEGPVGDHWVERTLFPAAERQIRGGWFIWAIRDAMAASGLAPDAGSAMRYYQRIADEVNAACDSGRVPARGPRATFLPPLGRKDLGPLWAGAFEYGTYFFGFDGFTARSPDSVGDYAELKPFRDLVGTHLSNAPRSPDPFPATQGVLEEWKVDRLEEFGRGTCRILTWLGLLLLPVGLVRLVESAGRHRISFPLGLAAALLVSSLAYLGINVLVHVTSFYNMSPAAMAAAYPLYLLALGLIAVDALAAWSSPAPALARTARFAWLLPAGCAVLVFGARLREVFLYASDVPFNDQWFIEADQIIAPWLNGTLSPAAFFQPHFEHLPVWTRLLSWLQVVLTGRWDPLVQMTVNAGLHAAFVWLVARWLWQTFTLRQAGLVTLILLLGSSWPHAWENITWGFQSQFPLALLCLFIHVHGVVTRVPGTRGWWLAQAAGLAGLFTLASMWLAPLALLGASLWIGQRDRRQQLVSAAIAGVGLLLLGIIHWRGPAGQSFAQVVQAPLSFLHSWLHLLSWPSGLPGTAAIVQLPWLILALRLRQRRETAAPDLIILALGLWALAHAGALALARTGDTGDFVSRYGDLFLVGILANALALVRLTPPGGLSRAGFLTVGLLWCGLVIAGLFTRATEGHARYFHQTAANSAQLRRNAVQAYLRDHDRRLIDATETRWILTQSTDVLTRLLDDPALRSRLPASVNPANPVDLAGRVCRGLQAHWPWLCLLGLLAAGTGLQLLARQNNGTPVPALVSSQSDPWPALLAGGVALACGLGLFLWSSPLAFNRDYRWRQLLGGDLAIRGLRYEFASSSPFGPERLQGAAPISPVELRNMFHGTAPEGPGFTGTVLGSPFTLTRPWLVVPIAGYPTGEGNGLRLRILGGSPEFEIGCPGPNQDGISFWTVDVRAYQGRQARLVLYDGRTGPQGWVAAADPIPTDNPAIAADLAQRLERESHSSLHSTLGGIALLAAIYAVMGWRARRRSAGEDRQSQTG